jgi:hypothetical protein
MLGEVITDAKFHEAIVVIVPNFLIATDFVIVARG